MEDDNEKPLDLEVVQGDGSDLEISKVYEHLNGTKPKMEKDKDKNKKIIIPKVENEQ